MKYGGSIRGQTLLLDSLFHFLSLLRHCLGTWTWTDKLRKPMKPNAIKSYFELQSRGSETHKTHKTADAGADVLRLLIWR